jgi:hypothetical protein
MLKNNAKSKGFKQLRKKQFSYSALQRECPAFLAGITEKGEC